MSQDRIEHYKYPCGLEIKFINAKDKTITTPYHCPIHGTNCPKNK